MTWPEIVARARQEGEVVWYTWYAQDRLRDTVRDFTNRYGIRVVIPDGDRPGNFRKFLAAQGSARGDIDVLSVRDQDFDKFRPEGSLIGPLTRLLPDANTLRFEIGGGHSHGYAVAFWGNQSGLAYNPALVRPDELPQTVEAFDRYMADHPDLLGLNAENGGSGAALVQSITRNLVPDLDFRTVRPDADMLAKLRPALDWFRAHRHRYVITASNVDSLSRLNGGEFALVAAWEDQLAGLQHQGEISRAIRFYVPAFGMPGGGNLAGSPSNAPHPAAALLFMNWLTSAETQTALNQTYGSAPQNAGASSAFGLVSAEDRKHATSPVPTAIGDALRRLFIDRVVLD